MIVRHRPLALLLATIALAGAGCGSSNSSKPDGAGGGGDTAQDDAAGSNGDNTLAETDIASVLEAKRQIDAACGSDGSTSSGSAATSQLAGAVSTLVTVTGMYPDKVYETGNEDRALKMTLVSQQVTQQLRRCGITDQADRLAKVSKT